MPTYKTTKLNLSIRGMWWKTEKDSIKFVFKFMVYTAMNFVLLANVLIATSQIQGESWKSRGKLENAFYLYE